MSERQQWQDRWEVVRRLSGGTGQGPVDLVRDTRAVGTNAELSARAKSSLGDLVALHVRPGLDPQESFKSLREVIVKIIEGEDSDNLGALKTLHAPEVARDAERAPERMRREIAAMSAMSHPNTLRILDHNADELWYVSEFHPGGTLDKCLSRFAGRLRATLDAFRPLVEGVAAIHSSGYVHRDIKTENIFIAADGRLVLGDFGLVFSSGDGEPRVSGTNENTGTRYWMPHWYEGRRLDDVKPDFDVFSLAKVLWAMLSGKARLPHWYFAKPEFDLHAQHPNMLEMNNVNDVLANCLVVEQEDCLPDANSLLAQLDSLRDTIDRKKTRLHDEMQWDCRVCGDGKYQLVLNAGKGNPNEFGLTPSGGNSYKILRCKNCGNIQLFHAGPGYSAKAWPTW